MTQPAGSPFAIANIRCFIAFRLFFNSRFYYPVFTILFLDYGLTIEQFALLNSVWAATIVAAEVPSGALADLFGRKALLVATSVFMVAEMALLSFVPLEHVSLVFYAFLFNRIFSGLAEAMASGADEALAYDSLMQQGSRDDWPKVLSVMMRIQAAGAVVTMSLGALVYDPAMVNHFLGFIGFAGNLDQQTTMRFPIYLTLVLALCCCAATLLMREEGKNGEHSRTMRQFVRDIRRACRLTMEAGRWILKTPFALVVIVFAMFYDHILRMVITMTSQYFRLINLPEASFGLIGAAMAMMGLIVPKVAEKMADRFSPTVNMVWLSLLTMAALSGIAAFIPYWGLLPMALVPAGLQLTAFFTSHYLNRITDSRQRATVLSFKGLAFNLAYGLIGAGFAGLISVLRRMEAANNPQWSQATIENITFKSGVAWFIPYALILLLLAILWGRHHLRNTTEQHRHG